MQIWDTSGQEKFRSITRCYYRNVAGCLLMYDITNRKSFDDIKIWLNEIRNISNEYIKIMLLGTKSDMNYNRQISTNEASVFASDNGLLFAETTATKPCGDVFIQLACVIFNQLKESKPNNFPGIKINIDNENISNWSNYC